MSPADELFALYRRWRQLTEDEGQAIDGGEWHLVELCQTAKSRLQPRIVEVSQRLDAASHETQFRPVVDELMELERRNRTRLEHKRRDAEKERQELDRSCRQLRRIHRSYVPAARTAWQSYS